MATHQQTTRRQRALSVVQNRAAVWQAIENGGKVPFGFDKDADPLVKLAQANVEIKNLHAKGL